MTTLKFYMCCFRAGALQLSSLLSQEGHPPTYLAGGATCAHMTRSVTPPPSLTHTHTPPHLPAPPSAQLTCDQVVVHEGRILEKPHNAAEARDFIRGYGRAPASTVGSVLCTDLATGTTAGDVDVSTIHFTPIPEATMEALIAEGDVLYCAGGLMVEHPAVVPHVVRIDGTQDGVMGLAKALVLRLMLEAAGL